MAQAAAVNPGTAQVTSTDVELPTLTLLNIGNGAAVELFQQELGKALENILDPNTEPEATRTIMLKVKVTPTSEERNQIAVTVEADSKLAPFRGAGSLAYVGRRRGEIVAVTHDPKQMQMQWDTQAKRESLPHPTT